MPTTSASGAMIGMVKVACPDREWTKKYNLVYFIGKQGCTWSCTITLNQYGIDPPTPIDLTEYSIRDQIRKTYSDATPMAEFYETVYRAIQGVIFVDPEVTKP